MFTKLHILVRRVHERLRMFPTKSARSISLGSGLSAWAANNILSGKVSDPRIGTVIGIAEQLDCTVAYLIGESDRPNPEEGVPPLAVIGIAEPGVWRDPVKAVTSLPPAVPHARDPRFLGMRQFLVDVSVQMPPYRYALCIDWVGATEAGMRMITGQLLFGELRRNYGKMIETAIFRADLTRGKSEITTYGSETDEPINISDDKNDVVIHGLVVNLTTPIDLKGLSLPTV